MASMRECVLTAAAGGLLPTAAKLATTYTTAPHTPPPELGLLYGLALFAAIGAILAYALSETNVRQALILGIAAPGVITNIVAGANSTKLGSPLSLYDVIPFASAVAQASSNWRAPKAPTDSKTLTLRAQTKNGDSWSNENLPVSVTFVLPDGTSMAPSALVPIGQLQHVVIPTQATAVRFSAGHMSRLLELESLPSAAIDIEVTVKGKNDFLWSLGARREAVVGNLKLTPSSQK